MDNGSTREGFGKALEELGKNNEIVVLAAGVGDSTMAFNFKKKFPERYVECGIAEQNMIGIASGLALAGKIPIATSFASFLPGRCYDQIRQSVCYSNLNVKLVATHAGITVGGDGATHQMMEDIAMLRALPNLKIIVPADAREAEIATYAIVKEKGAFFMRLGREKYPVFTNGNFKIGKAEILKQGKEKNHAAIIATGFMVYQALLASEMLEKENIFVKVINMHTIKPIDKEAIIQAAKETKFIITAEEHQIYGGLGGAVAEVLSQDYSLQKDYSLKKYSFKLKIIGMQDKFGESGKPNDLIKKYKLDAYAIYEAVKNGIKKNK